MIVHAKISSIVQEEYRQQKYFSVVQAAKKILLKEYGIILESVHGDGYRLVLPDDFTRQSLRHYKRGFNEFQKGMDVLSYAPTKYMSEEGRAEYRRVNDRAVILHASIKGATVELKTLCEKRHPFLPKNLRTERGDC